VSAQARALLVSIRDTPVEHATPDQIGHHPGTLTSIIRKGWARLEYGTLALTDRGRALVAHVKTQRCSGCVGLLYTGDLCVLAGKPLRKSGVSPNWCPGKVRPIV
jgi:hypothetical protein